MAAEVLHIFSYFAQVFRAISSTQICSAKKWFSIWSLGFRTGVESPQLSWGSSKNFQISANSQNHLDLTREATDYQLREEGSLLIMRESLFTWAEMIESQPQSWLTPGKLKTIFLNKLCSSKASLTETLQLGWVQVMFGRFPYCRFNNEKKAWTEMFHRTFYGIFLKNSISPYRSFLFNLQCCPIQCP